MRQLDGFRVFQGQRVAPAPGTRSDLPTVFLVNAYSDIPREMLALQAEGKAVVVSDGAVTNERLVTTAALSLTEGLVTRIRLGELVFADGVHRFQPDVVVADSADSRADDLPLVEAIRLTENVPPVVIPEPAGPDLAP